MPHTSTPQPPPSSPDERRRRWLDQAIGALLFVVSLLAVLGTNDMGFVRDEAFYFRHAETYQDWFVAVEEGGEERDHALRREEILRVWHNNAEHPPLDKILFGWSWRIFGRKLRPASGLSVVKGQLQARISGLGPAHGYQEGARVRLLRPQIVGQDADPARRVLATGDVIRRTRWGATVEFNLPDSPGDKPGAAASKRLKELAAICLPPGPDPEAAEGDPIRRTGCEAVESRATYWLSESDAMRAPGALFAALLVWLLWLTARGFFWSAGSRAPLMARPFAALAAVGYLLIPRAFYHAHLACFDMTIVTLLFATTVLFHTSLRRPRWAWLVAVLWGLSLLAKHNAMVLPGALMAHWLWDGVMEGRLTISGPDGGPIRLDLRAAAVLVATLALAVAAALVSKLLGVVVVLAGLAVLLRVQLPTLPVAWFLMLPIGLSILVAGWPLLWVDTLDNFLKWLEFHLHHEHYMQVYFGRVLAYPPFPFEMPWVLTALTWPLTLLLPAVVGVLAAIGQEVADLVGRLALRRGAERTAAAPGGESGTAGAASAAAEARSFRRLCLMSAIWPIFLIALPSTPVFGGTKHWFLAYPFMLLLAGQVLDRVWRWALAHAVAPHLSSPRAVAAAWLLVLLVAAPAAKATWDVHPQGTAFYNELIGGAPGAAKAGLQRQFWGGATRAGLAVVNARAPRHARVWFHNSAWGAYRMYQREGWFRRDLSYSNEPDNAAFGFYHHQRAHDDYELDWLKAAGLQTPVAQVHIEGVPLLSVYQRRPSTSITP